jgi:hypothetical protein
MQIFDPVRVKRSYTQKLNGRPDEVFSLLCPVREKEWAKGWDPIAVYSASGFAEKDCVFTTGGEAPESIWVITEFDPALHLIEIIKVSPGLTACRITISLTENDSGNTDLHVEYTYTAISSDGEEFVRGYTQEFFDRFMRFSESALNDFLENR